LVVQWFYKQPVVVMVVPFVASASISPLVALGHPLVWLTHLAFTLVLFVVAAALAVATFAVVAY
jgi:hypothetical protein